MRRVRAGRSVRRRLLAALVREGVGDARRRWGRSGRRFGFGQVEVVDPPDVPFGELLPAGSGALVAELDDAVANLAVAYRRAPGAGGAHPLAGLDWAGPDGSVAAAERWATEGHNLHPCGRTRLGWSPDDVLAHDVEGPLTGVRFVAVPRAGRVGDPVGDLLAAAFPQVPAAPPGWVVQPVHAWQWGRLAGADGVRRLDGLIPAAATLAVRTLLLPRRWGYLKLSLDVQITSTRRTISPASAANGPRIAAVLAKLLADDEAGQRAVVLAETAGAAVPGVVDGRAASVIVREPLAGRLADGERVWPATALVVPDATGRPAVAGLVARYAAVRGCGDGPVAAARFLAEYARLLLAPVLRLATVFGVGLEAHLQNCLPTFVGGVPHRMVFRDLAGLRLHRPRLAAAGVAVGLAPGSVVGTDDVGVLRAKVCYTAFQAHLAELVRVLGDSYGLDEAAAWRGVRELVDELAGGGPDHAAWTAPMVPHKALVTMRLRGGGDVYVPVPNPLAGRW